MVATELGRRWVAFNRHTHSKRTQENYQRIIWRFVSRYAPHDLANTTVEHIERYLDDKLKTCSTRTTNTHLNALKSFFRWLNERYDLPNPAAKIKTFKMPPPKQRVLSLEEYEKVLAVCKPQEADLITFLAHTGLRSSELRSLTWQNVDTAKPPKFIAFLGKGNKRRFVPLNRTSQHILGKYKRGSDTTPLDFTKSRRSRNAMLYLCHRLADRAAISRFGPHALRHFMATQLHRKKVDLSYISKTLGHASTRVTESVYVHWADTDLLGITDCLDEK